MKKALFLLLIIISFAACTNANKKEENIVYSTDFTDAENWKNDYENDFYTKVKNGRYLVQNRSENSTYVYFDRKTLPVGAKDFEVIAQIKLENGKKNYGYGLAFGDLAKTDGVKHFFKIADLGGYSYFRSPQKRNKNIPWKLTTLVDDGMFNELKVKRVQDKIYFFINGACVDEVDAEENYYGSIGFIVDPYVVIEVEDLIVKGDY